MGISIKAFWETTESDFNELAQRLQRENKSSCPKYQSCLGTIQKMILLGKGLEAYGWTSLLKLKADGEKLQSLPKDFGEDELPHIESEATLAFAQTYLVHLMRYLETEFSPEGSFIKKSDLDGAKKKITYLVNALENKVKSYLAVPHSDIATPRMLELNRDEPVSLDSSSSENIFSQLPFEGVKTLLQYHPWLNNINACLNLFYTNVQSDFSTVEIDYSRKINNITLYSLQTMMENYIQNNSAMDRSMGVEKFTIIRCCQMLQKILKQFQRYEDFLTNWLDENNFQFDHFWLQYEIMLNSVLYEIKNSLDAVASDPMISSQAEQTELIKHFRQLFTFISSKRDSSSNHLAHLKSEAKKWLVANPIKTPQEDAALESVVFGAEEFEEWEIIERFDELSVTPMKREDGKGVAYPLCTFSDINAVSNKKGDAMGSVSIEPKPRPSSEHKL